MTWNPGLTRLRDLLATLYPTEIAARQVVAFAGLPSGSVHFSPAADENWYSILTQAALHDQVSDIVDVACREFPESASALRQASDEHHQHAATLIQERHAQVLKASSPLAQTAAVDPSLLPAPMSAEEITKRHQADVENGRPWLERAVRIIPKASETPDGTLGPAERDYVVVADYDEQRFRSRSEIIDNLWAGTDEEKASRHEEKVALVFSVGAQYQEDLDLKAATWKSIFWILACHTKLSLFRMTKKQQKTMGRGRDRDYFKPEEDQGWWYEQLLEQLGKLKPPQTLELLERRLGIGLACFRGDGTSAGTLRCRLFLVKNVALKDLHYQPYDLGTFEDNRILP